MSDDAAGTGVVTATREIAATAAAVFELVADPALQPRWDGNDNLAAAAPGQRVHDVGETFVMELTGGAVRHNHVVEFEEGRRIAWRPSEPGSAPPGHLWRWTLEPLDAERTLVTHTYDWTQLTDPNRLAKARSTTSANLQASLTRLAGVAERRDHATGLGAIRHLDYTVLLCRDLTMMRRFYGDVMGFIEASHEISDQWIEFRVGASVLALRPHPANSAGIAPVGAPSVQLAFRVPPGDVATAAAQLEGIGIEIVQPVTDHAFGHRTLFFADPEQNIIEIYAEI